ncbi:MAG: hypothetical protein V4501_11225 [Pseudomonadota bacterium]
MAARQITMPVNISGSSKFGRYPLISSERTYNRYTSDGFGVDFSGWIKRTTFPGEVEGRGAFPSIGGFILIVRGASVYRLAHINSTPIFLFNIGSSTGLVTIAENLSSQISIVGGNEWWIYNYLDNSFAQITPTGDLVPGFIRYQNSFFLVANTTAAVNSQVWQVYNGGAGTTVTLNIELTIQTKHNTAEAVIPIPGAGNNALVMGQTVSEPWQQRGGAQNYYKNSSTNCDYGVVSVETIASQDKMVVWLAVNEASSPVIMVYDGSRSTPISSDGITFLLDTVRFPSQSYASFYRQDGHLFYLLSFYNVADNFTIMYDFNTKLFFDVTDWDFSVFPGRQIIRYEGQDYFISYKDGQLYEIGSDIPYIQVDDDTQYEIQRIRTCDTQMTPDGEPFDVDAFTYIIENGTQPNDFSINPSPPRIDIRISNDGGYTFGNIVPFYMEPTGHFLSRPYIPNLGRYNRITIQMRFWSKWRFVTGNGTLRITL